MKDKYNQIFNKAKPTLSFETSTDPTDLVSRKMSTTKTSFFKGKIQTNQKLIYFIKNCFQIISNWNF